MQLPQITKMAINNPPLLLLYTLLWAVCNGNIRINEVTKVNTTLPHVINTFNMNGMELTSIYGAQLNIASNRIVHWNLTE